MLMRYVWGHGIGHTYSHGDAPNAITPVGGSELDPSGTLSQATHVKGGLTDDFEEAETEEQAENPHSDSSGGLSAADDTLEDLEGEELAVAGPDEEWVGMEEFDVQEPESDEDAG